MIQEKNTKEEKEEFTMFNEMRTKAFWKNLMLHYQQGAHWDHDTSNLVADVVSVLNKTLYMQDSAMGLKVNHRGLKKPLGFKTPRINGITIVYNTKQTPIKLKVLVSRVMINGRMFLLGHENAVPAFANEIIDEVEAVLKSKRPIIRAAEAPASLEVSL